MNAIPLISDLLNGKLDVNVDNGDRETPLLIVSRIGNIELVKRFVSHGANLDIENKYGMTPILCAVGCGHYEISDYLFDNVRDQNLLVRELIRIISIKGKIPSNKITQYLLTKLSSIAKKLELQLTNGDDRTALMIAALYGYVSVVQWLVSYGANCNAIHEKSGLSVLAFACLSGSIECVQIILGGNKKINCLDSKPLIIAVQQGNIKCVELLIKKGFGRII